MGYSIGFNEERDRFIGYAVPAVCEHPDCNEEIHRGMSYACGGGFPGDNDTCSMYFCEKHLSYFADDDTEWCAHRCERCLNGEEPFKQKPDTSEWVKWMLDDESWAEWRNDNPDKVKAMRATL